eukprot:494632-Rhodomonas_salina.3
MNHRFVAGSGRRQEWLQRQSDFSSAHRESSMTFLHPMTQEALSGIGNDDSDKWRYPARFELELGLGRRIGRNSDQIRPSFKTRYPGYKHYYPVRRRICTRILYNLNR